MPTPAAPKPQCHAEIRIHSPAGEHRPETLVLDEEARDDRSQEGAEVDALIEERERRIPPNVTLGV
jgi:hypothetical protein